jgi:arylsulfatase A
VFTSDNGGLAVKEGANTPATTNAPLRASKGYLYEGGIRVPMIVRWPGVTTAGSICDTAVSSVDYFPTLCEAAGVKPTGTLDGRTLMPLLRDPRGRFDRQAIYWHYPHFSNQGGDPGAAVRAGDWKLILGYEHGKVELFNLREDMSEKNDLAAKMPEKARELRAMLEGWLKAVNANMPKPNPEYKAP